MRGGKRPGAGRPALTDEQAAAQAAPLPVAHPERRADYYNEAELFKLHGLPAPPGPGGAAVGVRHRPVSGFSRTLEAACLYRELGRRGLNGRESAEAVRAMLGTSRASVLKYQSHPVEPSSLEDDRRMAEFVVARYWDNMIRRNWRALTPKARDALKPIVDFRLMGERPPT